MSDHHGPPDSRQHQPPAAPAHQKVGSQQYAMQRVYNLGFYLHCARGDRGEQYLDDRATVLASCQKDRRLAIPECDVFVSSSLQEVNQD